MKIKILCVGKIKEQYFKDGISYYKKMLEKKHTVEILECSDEPIPDHASPKQEEQILITEGTRILEKITRDDRVIALCIEGNSYTSDGLRKRLSKPTQGSLCFVIGGSLGLSQAVTARADEKISFSAMTFPHQMMRLILLEQLSRIL